MSGILFLTASLNGETMQNVVNILFNKTVIKEYNLPQVNKITFFKLPELKKIEFENGEMTVENGIQRVVDSLDNSEIEKRTLTINDSASQIPGIIMDAMKEVGKSNIILDLTSGRKDITGSMYTAASISQIANMVYMEVFKDENEEFLELSYKDEEILPKFSIKIFKSLGEIENLASMNYIDFVIYKKTIEEMGASFDEVDKDYFESYKIQLNNAVNSYFSVAADGYLNCAKSIGVLNENFIGKLLDYLKKNLQSIYPDDLVSGKIPVSFIDKIEKDYNKLSTKKNCLQKSRTS